MGCASPFTRYASVALEVAADGSLGWATAACYHGHKCNLCKAHFERCSWPGSKHRSLPPLKCSCTTEGMRNTNLASIMGQRTDLGQFCMRGVCDFAQIEESIRGEPTYAQFRLSSYGRLCVYKVESPAKESAAYGCDLEPPAAMSLNEPTGSRFVQYFYESWLEVRCRDTDLCNDRKHFGSKEAFFKCPFALKQSTKSCPWDPDPVSFASTHSHNLIFAFTPVLAINAWRF